MKYVYKNQLRNMKHHLFYTISIAILLFIVSLVFTTITTSVNRLETTYDSYIETQNTEDFYFSMGEIDISYLSGSATVTLCKELDLTLECGLALSEPSDTIALNNLNVTINNRIKERPDLYQKLIDEYVTIFEEDYNFTIEEKPTINIEQGNYLYKFTTVSNEISLPYIVEGRLPSATNEIMVFPEFITKNNLTIGETYTIDNTAYTITGTFYSPDFTFPIFSLNSIDFNPKYQTLIITSPETFDAFDQSVFQKYIAKGDLSLLFDEFTYDSLYNADFSRLGKHMQLIEFLVPSDINYRINALEQEVNTASVFIESFFLLFTVFIIIILSIFIKQYMDENKDDIYTLRALGYTDHELTKSFLLFPLIISTAFLLGYLSGLLLSTPFYTLYSSRYLLPNSELGFQVSTLFYAVILPMILLLILFYFYITYTLQRLHKPKRQKRFLFPYTPLKTTLTSTILFIVIGVMLILGFSGQSMFDTFTFTTKQGNHYEEMINLEYLINTPPPLHSEPYTKQSAKITHINDEEYNYRATIYGINPNTTLKELIINNAPQNERLTRGIIISKYVSEQTNSSVGDTLKFTVGNYTISEEIVGVSNELIEGSIYIDQTTLNNAYGLDSTYYNGLYIVNSTYDSPYITSRINYNKSVDEFSSILTTSSVILQFILTLSVILALYIFSLLLLRFYETNKRPMAILKSIGFYHTEINKLYLGPLYIMMIISLALSIPITFYIMRLLVNTISTQIGFQLVFSIKLLSITLSILLLHILFFIIVLATTKYYDSIDIKKLLH